MVRKIIKILGVILVVISILIPIIYLFYIKADEYNYNVTIKAKIDNSHSYFAILEIPDIELKRELFEISDDRNNVNENILVHELSVMPNNGKSNIILAGHSGIGKNAYFKNLYKLNIGDIVKLYFNEDIYTYQIKEIEYQDKTGDLYLKEDYTNMITLITCTHNNSETQTIYYASLQKIEKMSKI